MSGPLALKTKFVSGGKRDVTKDKIDANATLKKEVGGEMIEKRKKRKKDLVSLSERESEREREQVLV